MAMPMTCDRLTDLGLSMASDNYIGELQVPSANDHDSGVTDDWPLKSSLELAAFHGAVPCARLHTRQVVWEWGFGELGNSCELIVSELVTNSVQASRALGRFSTVRLWLRSDKAKVLILVWDASPHPPAPARADLGGLTDSGRGLFLVDAMSEEWSWYFPADTGGKVVWALCGTEEAT
jgi:anti-sigma regulatory factor (Ser/Thr protein kinase)